MTEEAHRYCMKQSCSGEFTGFAIRNNRTFAASLRGTKQSGRKRFSCRSDSEERVILRALDFVILLYWIASFLAMTEEARRYCAKQSAPGERAKSRRDEIPVREKE
jgi:hypothetical protein